VWLELTVDTNDEYMAKQDFVTGIIPMDYYGYRCINYATCSMDGGKTEIVRHLGEWMVIQQQLCMGGDDLDLLRTMSTQNQQYSQGGGAAVVVLVPLMFWFCQRGLSTSTTEQTSGPSRAIPIPLTPKPDGHGRIDIHVEFNLYDPQFREPREIRVLACEVMSTVYTIGDPLSLARFLSPKKVIIEKVLSFESQIGALSTMADIVLPFTRGKCARLVWVLTSPVILDTWQSEISQLDDNIIANAYKTMSSEGQSYAGSAVEHGSNLVLETECFDSTPDKCIFPSRPAHYFSHLQRLWYGRGIDEAYTAGAIKPTVASQIGHTPSVQRRPMCRDAIYMYSFSTRSMTGGAALPTFRSNIRESQEYLSPCEYTQGFLDLAALQRMVLRLQFKDPNGLPSPVLVRVFAVLYATLQINAVTGDYRLEE
jgi:hypothetical protein